jgi:hypothetical protein
MKRKINRSTRLERANEKKMIIEKKQSGEGLYLFRNRNSAASLELPKPSKDGRRWIEPNATWEGDNYFFTMIPENAVLVKTISEPKKEEVNMEEKLILDQPEQITKAGKVEHKVAKGLPLNETAPDLDAESKERLLTEDPLAGVTIIRD